MRLRWLTVSFAATLLACSSSDTKQEPLADGGSLDLRLTDMTQPDLAHLASAVSFTSPAVAQIFERSSVAADASQVAKVTLSVQATPDIVRVEFRAEDVISLGETTGPSFALTHEFGEDGPRWVRAIALDVAGKEVARARVDFTIKAGPVLSCRDKLLALDVVFTVGPSAKGVADPVTVSLPLNGVDYYTDSATNPQSKLFMDCSLALALYRLAETSRPKGIVALVHLGVYNYRCIGGGNPDTDDCTPSQHAYAKAIDIHELRDSSGERFNLKSDWVIDPDSEKTCMAGTANDKDKLLHELSCLWNAATIFQIILTPNFNAAHRDHFHVDLTKGSNYINATSPDSVGVDPPLSISDD